MSSAFQSFARKRGGTVVQAGKLQLFLHPPDDIDRPPQRLEMTFDVDDADDAIAHMRDDGVPVPEEASDRDWGDRDGAVEDPDGNIVYLRSSPRVGPESRQASLPAIS